MRGAVYVFMSSQTRVSIDWWHLKLNFLLSPPVSNKHCFVRHKSGIKSHSKKHSFSSEFCDCACAALKKSDELLTQKILSAFMCSAKPWGWKESKRPDEKRNQKTAIIKVQCWRDSGEQSVHEKNACGNAQKSSDCKQKVSELKIWFLHDVMPRQWMKQERGKRHKNLSFLN